MRRPYYYLLEGKEIKGVSFDEYLKYASDENILLNKKIKRDIINGYLVSTVFLFIDHGVFEEKPVLFETMIFNMSNYTIVNYQERYSTYDESLEGHERAIQYVKNLKLDPDVKTESESKVD